VFEANLEPDLRRIPGDRGLRKLSEIHGGERVEILLLCPLLRGAYLFLEAFGE
jgi:hypothetical protein